MDKLDEGLKTLLDLGKRRGFLTFDQVNDYLPDEASSPEKIHGLLETLDEMGIELINEDEAETRLLASGDLDDEPDETGRRAARRRRSRAHARRPRRDLAADRRPGADVPDADGRDPAARPASRKSPWPRRSRSPASGSAARCSNATSPWRWSSTSSRRSTTASCPFDRTVKVSLTENLEKDQILGRMPHNLRDARTT